MQATALEASATAAATRSTELRLSTKCPTTTAALTACIWGAPPYGRRAWYWHLVAPTLQERGHEAVAVELPAADDRAGLPQYADTAVRAIPELVRRAVVMAVPHPALPRVARQLTESPPGPASRRQTQPLQSDLCRAGVGRIEAFQSA
jgi:hypothetical protein